MARELGGLLGQKRMARELIISQSKQKYLEILKVEPTVVESCARVQQPTTLRNLVPVMPQRMGKCLVMNGKYIHCAVMNTSKRDLPCFTNKC